MTAPIPTPPQLADLKRALDARRLELRGQLDEHRHGQAVNDPTDVQTRDDQAQRMPERELATALSLHEQQELAQINAALRRMSQGGYGECADCGCAIPLARLQAEPWALRCVACETRHERG